MIGLLGTVVGMIGAFTVLQDSGMGGESSQKMAGNIGSAFGQPPPAWSWPFQP